MVHDTEPGHAPATRIRRAAPGDAPALHDLVLELARYEREPDAVEASAEDLDRALFADHPLVHAHVAEVSGPAGFEIAGMALWFVSYSTWRGRHGIWLEDLFVLPAHRRLGLGRALLAELAAETVARGYARLEWNVLDWNEPALSFYRGAGRRTAVRVDRPPGRRRRPARARRHPARDTGHGAFHPRRVRCGQPLAGCLSVTIPGLAVTQRPITAINRSGDG